MDAVAHSPNANNTLVIVALGDNGASAEGGLDGTINNMGTQNGFPDNVASMLKVIDEIGGPKHENHFSVGWAWAVDTPFQWTKQVASHFGGTRSGFLISWPEKIAAHGEVRSQWHHMVDVAPTVYEAVGIPAPAYVNGIKQQPLSGVSMLYTFNDKNAPSRHHTQYFEIMGNRAIYHDGWIASARHGIPWVLVGRKGDFENDKWELYNLNDDFSQADDLAARNPAKLKEMQALFESEAKKNHVYPMDDRFSERGNVPDRPSLTQGRSEMTFYPGSVRIPEGSAPNVKARTHSITAVFSMPDKGAQGVIVAAGGSAGYTLFVKNNHLVYENNFFGRERDVITSKDPLPKGTVTAIFEYTQEDKTIGGGGTGRLVVNGKEEGKMKFNHVVPYRYGATETFDIGEDTGEAVSTQYEGPFPFTGQLDHVTFKIQPSQATAEQQEKARQMELQIEMATE
ncbi:sulfatase-like hydrolase/transferase [Dyella sp. C11]|uniref:sulfatase-like hydrolase/transferase n=1 Tax=Dyella sp. C11 TaxID=2126991 RepID=UPI0018E519F9|nr:sulfatase-like hydrolase/transferase [Dyella sp. C11]